MADALVPARLGNKREGGAQHMPAQGRGHTAVIARIHIAVVAVVAAEELIPAVAANDHFHMLPRKLGDMVGAQREGIGRLIEVVDEVREQSDKRGAERTLVMLRPVKM